MRAAFRMIVSVAALSLLPSGPARAEKFKKDDPIHEDFDNLSIPQPTDRPLSKTVDLFQKTFTTPEGGTPDAQNVNTLGEVPDSSWFENRMGHRVMSIEELVRGPNQGSGPDMTGRFTLIAAKTEGATPGLRIRDASGEVFFLKFDPLHWPQMATSAEIIGTKFFYAFGYRVPENYLIYWTPEYDIDPDAEVLWDSGHTESLSRGYVEDLLETVPLRPDGTIQAVASKFLPGRPIGPFDFQGTRSDDPNDIFPHEDRRELRGLKLFTAWMNHNDSDAVNTLDMYYTDDDGRSYVRHNLIDFGTIMGSGATHAHARRVGNEYYIEFEPSLKAAATLGIWDRPWRHVKYEEYPAVGRFESDYFQPEAWKPDYPNPAFDKMTLVDALWATRSIMRFSDEAIEAIVRTGRIDDPEAERYVIDALIERRDKIVRYYLAQINPLDGFEVSGGNDARRLEFVNLGLEAGLRSECAYEYVWHTFDNDSEVLSELGTPGTTSTTSVPIPRSEASYLMARLSSSCAGQPEWASAVEVYLKSAGDMNVVGIERALPSRAAEPR